MRRIARKLAATEGTEIVEAAFVFPVLFMLLLGVLWFGRAFQIYGTMTQAAHQGAVIAARPACATCPLGPSTWDGTSFPGDLAVESAVFSVTDASRLDQNLITPVTVVMPFCPSPPGACASSPSGKITICRSVQLNPGSNPAQCGIVIGFQYPFQLTLPFTSLNMQSVTLKAQAQSRMEN